MVGCSRVLVGCRLAVDSGFVSVLVGLWFGCWLSCWSVVVVRRSGDSCGVDRLLVGCGRYRLGCLSVAAWAVVLCRFELCLGCRLAALAVLVQCWLVAGSRSGCLLGAVWLVVRLLAGLGSEVG